MAKTIVLRVAAALTVLYGVLLLLASSQVPPVYTASSEIILEASIEDSWGLLTNFEDYEIWNPYLINVEGTLRAGEPVTITLVNENFKEPFTTTPHLASVDPPRQFHWENGFLLPGVYDTRHYFVLEATGQTETRLVQFEEFRGALVWLLPGKNQRKAAAEKGFDSMHRALNDRLSSH